MKLRRQGTRIHVRRGALITSAVVLLMILHFIGWLRPVEDFVVFLGRPIVRGTANAARSITGSFSFVRSISHLASENDDLKRRVEKLEAENSRLAEVERENTALREQLKFSARGSFNLEPSFVVGYDPTSFTEFLTLDKGSETGIQVGNPVITESGLCVGRIAEVGWKNSKVLLTIDSGSTINATVQDSRANGVVKGDHGLGLLMELIPQDEVIKQGDRVVTSGLGGLFPKGLVLGEVESVSQQENELFQTARLKPSVSFKEVEIVFVIKSF